MLVSCPKCQSRYKLPEEKIRPSGTKVRCPRCQHTFHVYGANQEEAPAAASPVLPPGKEVTAAKAPAAPAKEPSPFSAPQLSKKTPVEVSKKSNLKVDEDSSPTHEHSQDGPSFIESAETIVSYQQNDTPTGLASPFKQEGSKKVKAESFDSDVSVKNRLSSSDRISVTKRDLEKDSSEEAVVVRPFGDATLAEIQIKNRPARSKSRLVLSFLVLALAGGAGYYVYFKKFAEESSRSSAKIEKALETPLAVGEQALSPVTSTPVKRPANWYKEDPGVLQDYLSQMAGLPATEQQKPENRSVIAEALILNGLLSGADDQIVSGMGFASGLLAAYPQSAYGFYGLTSYALWKEDLNTLTDLVKRWPLANQSDPEYKLAKILTEGRTQGAAKTLSQLKVLMSEYPDWFRTEAWVLSLAFDRPKEAEEIFGINKLQALWKSYERRRGQIRPGATPTSLFLSIEKKAKRNKPFLDQLKKVKAEKSKADSKSEEEVPIAQNSQTEAPQAAATAEEPAVSSNTEKPSSEASATAVAEKAATEATTAASSTRKKEPVKTSAKKEPPTNPAKKTLPKADPNLVAMNHQTTQARKKAMELYEVGLQRQKENKIDEAIQAYQSALREDPDMGDVYKQLGMIYMNRQEKERALRAFKIYLQLKPESQDRQVVQGWISSMQ